MIHWGKSVAANTALHWSKSIVVDTVLLRFPFIRPLGNGIRNLKGHACKGEQDAFANELNAIEARFGRDGANKALKAVRSSSWVQRASKLDLWAAYL